MLQLTGNPCGSVRSAWLTPLLLALFIHAGVAFCDTPHLIRNINTTVVPASSSPGYLGDLGGKMLFGAADATGPGLWVTDGSAGGTSLLSRLAVYPQNTFPGSPTYVVMNGKGYFIADDGVTGSQVWSTDGTPSGTAMVANLGPGAVQSFYGLFGSLLVFQKTDASNLPQLYVTDGTSAGTHALTSLSGLNASVGKEFLVVGSKFYFATSQAGAGGIYIGQMWVSDGTPAGTRPITNPFGSSTTGIDALSRPHSFELVGNAFLYTSAGLLWSIDTTTDTLSAVTPSGGTPGFGPPTVIDASGLIGMNGYVLYLADGILGGQNWELWRSDGTTAGTYRVAVVNPGPFSFDAWQYPLFQKVGDRVLFIGSDAQYGSQLWSSDGTSANTGRLTNVTEPANLSYPIAVYHATIAGTAYVSLPDGAQSTTWSVWRTDGTTAGTERVGGLPAIDQSEVGGTQLTGDASTVYLSVWTMGGTTSLFRYAPQTNATTTLSTTLSMSSMDGFLYDMGRLYFSTNDPVMGDEPWVSDGTAAGTRLIADLDPQTDDGGSSPDEFVNFNGALAFVADDGVHGRELWTSDGTAAGTVLLADINPGPASSNPSHLFVAGGVLYFFATDASGVQKFMRLSGSPASVQTLATISPQPVMMYPYAQPPACFGDTPAVLNGRIYLGATEGQSGVELWSTDGTAAGTNRVADISPGANDSNPCELTVLGNRLYFSAAGPGGSELWTSDGTGAGTQQVLDIASGTASSSPSGLTVFNGALYFTAYDSADGWQVWRSNGLAAGTQALTQFVPATTAFTAPLGGVNGKLLIVNTIAQGQPGSYQNQLWSSDGTTGGTAALGVLLSGDLQVNGALAYFSGSGTVGIEPWVSDGTTGGTHVLKDINPTPQSVLSWFANFNGVTVFAVSDPVNGTQLWRSDGTATGTSLISTVPPDALPAITATASNRHQLTVGQTLFFVGNDPTTGSELYGLTNAPPIASPDQAGSTNDEAVSINVLVNDTDSDGTLDPSSVQVVTAAAHGTATVQPNGMIVYTPASGFSGSDTFTYTVRDNQGAISNAATVTVAVTAPATASRGGGGAFDIVDLLGLLMLMASQACSRRRQSQRIH